MALHFQILDHRCRACLSNNCDLIPLQETAIIDGVLVLLSEILYNCSSIQQLPYDDRMPQNICVSCSVNAQICYKFRQDCERSDIILQKEIKEKYGVKIENKDLGLNLDTALENDSDDPLDSMDIMSQSELKTDETNIIHSDCSNTSSPDITKESKDDKSNIPPESVPIEDRTCTECGKVFKFRTNMFRHRKSHGSKKTCEYCDFVPERPSKLFKHMEEKHAQHKTITCTICGKTFFRKKNLQCHMTMHSGIKRHTCEICGLSFALGGNLTAHKRLHTGDKPYTCTECGKGFAQYAALHSHQAMHSEKRNHVCNVCGAAFSRAGSLSNHRKRHTDNRPFTCAMCKKTFTFRTELKRHMAIHTGIKNFECEVCGKRFNRNTNLTVHLRIHTGETPHTCHVCGKGFIQAHCLRTHLNTHNK